MIYKKIEIIVPTIIKMIPITKLIQIGENTQSQDQEITLHNFNTINTIVRSPQKPIPPLLLFSISFTYLIFKMSLFYFNLIYKSFQHEISTIHLFSEIIAGKSC